MEERKWLKSRPVVRFNEVARRVGSESYARVLMHRLVRAGKIKQVERGAYSASTNIFAIASNLHYPSYISFISASYLHGLTQAIPVTVYVATAREHKETEALGYRLRFVRLESMWGFCKERQGEEDVFIADVGKLMIDAFLKPECMGNFQEIENVFANAPEPDIEKLRGYLQRLGSERVWRQAGYLLEKHRGIDISGLMEMSRNYYPANPFAKGSGINRKWRLRT